MATLYPVGYGTQLVTLDMLRRLHGPGMHPEFERRIFPWIQSKDGLIGIGDGERPCPDPVSTASMNCESFHQRQRFASGRVAYAAVDLVARKPGSKHRAPTWSESDDAPTYGLHTFIGKGTTTTLDDESWHLQCIEMRGFATWVQRGRPDPPLYPLPTDPPPPPGKVIRMQSLQLAGTDGKGYRLLDTRTGPKLTDTTQVGVTDPAANGALAVSVNLTVVETEGPGNLAAWSSGINPGTSKVNWTIPNAIVANEVTIGLGAFGTFQVHPSGPLHLVIDVVGYWFP